MELSQKRLRPGKQGEATAFAPTSIPALRGSALYCPPGPLARW